MAVLCWTMDFHLAQNKRQFLLRPAGLYHHLYNLTQFILWPCLLLSSFWFPPTQRYWSFSSSVNFISTASVWNVLHINYFSTFLCLACLLTTYSFSPSFQTLLCSVPNLVSFTPALQFFSLYHLSQIRVCIHIYLKFIWLVCLYPDNASSPRSGKCI